MQYMGTGYAGDFSAARLLGMSPANQSKAAGTALPPTTVAGGDRAAVWWHPDSPTFWLVVIGAGTVLGIAGASARVRVFRGTAAAEVGRT